MTIFKTYDIRGVWKKELNLATAKKIGKALGTFVRSKDVCVGYDTRSSSPQIFKAFSEGLVSTGCKVISLGMIPNPINYFYSLKNRIFGCYITASHNPMEWNGFKMINPKGVSFVVEMKKIKEIFNSNKFLVSKKKGKIENYENAIEDYKNFLSEKLGVAKGKIVFECFGGAGATAIEVFNSLGLEVIELHCKPNGHFYGFERPEPKGKNLNILIRTVKKEKADFGVAFDGDADRSVFVDDKGRELNGSIMSYIFIEDILKKKKGTIILAADCSSELKNLTEKNGGELIWWGVGHGFIEKKCVEEKALFAGEQSSHFYFNQFYPFSDGILSTLYLAKMLNENGKKLSQLINKIKLHPTEKIYINAKTDRNKDKAMEKIRKEFPDAIHVIDGIKIFLNSIEWVLIRESRTLPEINLCIEARNKKRLKEIREKYSKIIKAKIKER
jgi:phosphomannomutase/phosphoglucomutase